MPLNAMKGEIISLIYLYKKYLLYIPWFQFWHISLNVKYRWFNSQLAPLVYGECVCVCVNCVHSMQMYQIGREVFV